MVLLWGLCDGAFLEGLSEWIQFTRRTCCVLVVLVCATICCFLTQHNKLLLFPPVGPLRPRDGVKSTPPWQPPQKLNRYHLSLGLCSYIPGNYTATPKTSTCPEPAPRCPSIVRELLCRPAWEVSVFSSQRVPALCLVCPQNESLLAWILCRRWNTAFSFTGPEQSLLLCLWEGGDETMNANRNSYVAFSYSSYTERS